MAGAGAGEAHAEIAEGAIDVDASGVARAACQQVVLVPGRTIARIDVAQLGGDIEARQCHAESELGAADARLVHIHADADVIRRRIHEQDQVVDARLEHVEGPVPVVFVLGHTDVQAFGLLRFQVRAFRARVVQVVEGWGFEAGAVRRIESEAIAEGQAPACAAGEVIAELLVVVVAHAGLPLMRADASLVLDEHARVIATVHAETGAAGDVVLLPVASGRQQVAFGEGEVGLHGRGVALRIEGVDESAEIRGCRIAVIRIGLVVGAAGLHGELQAIIGAPGQFTACYALGVLRLVAAEDAAVVFVVGIGVEEVAFQRQCVGQVHATAQRHRDVAVAVFIGFVGEAALEQRARSTAGVDAVGFLVGALGADPAALRTVAETGAGFAQVVAAGADAEMRLETEVTLAGEDLDHPADRFRTVQAGARAAHDLDAFDLVDRQVLERSQARGGRADAHAVHQHQHVVRFGAAQEHRGQLAGAALVGEVDTGAAFQQFGQRTRLGALDFLPVDDLRRQHAVLKRDFGAGGGDDDLVEIGGVGGDFGRGQRRKAKGDGQREAVHGGDTGLHGELLHRARPVRGMSGWSR